MIVPPEEVGTMTVAQIFPDSLTRDILDAVARTIRSGTVQAIEYAIAVGEAGPRHFEVRLARMSNDRVTAIVRNVTKERERDLALFTERERLEAVLGTTSAILYAARLPSFEVEYISESATAVLGFSTRECMTPGFWVSALHPDDSATVLRDLERRSISPSENIMRSAYSIFW
jgi:hypothetical protein